MKRFFASFCLFFIVINPMILLTPNPTPASEIPAPLIYKTTWLGNSFGGGPKWVQNFAEDLSVLPDGTCVVGSFWDESGREVGLYKNGQPIAKLDHTHMRGG